MDPRTLATGMGIIRSGVGAALVVAPAWAGRIWVGPDADGPGTKVLARALGARDVVLGGAILAAGRSGDPAKAGRYVRHGIAADVADVVATGIAFRHLDGNRRVMMPIVAAAVGALGMLAARAGGGDVTAAAEESTQDADVDGSTDDVDTSIGDDADSTAEAAGVVDQQGVVLEMADSDPAVHSTSSG